MKQISQLTTKTERLSYAGYFFGQNIIYALMSQYLMLYYTDVLGLASVVVGTLFFVARAWDAMIDPVMGVLVDKSRFKGGKFKPWVNFGILAMPISTALVFFQIDGGTTTKILYAYITYILWGMLYSISDIPIYALSTVMSKDINDRVKIISLGRIFAFIGTLVAAVATIPAAQHFGWTKGVLLLMAIAMISMIPVKYKTYERVKDTSATSPSPKEIFSFLLGNKYILIFNAAWIVCSFTNVMMPSLAYFTKYNLGNESLIPFVTLVAMLPSLLIPLFLPALIRQFGKKPIFLSAVAFYIATSILSYVIGYSNFAVVLVLMALRGIGFSVPSLINAMFTVDCVEYSAYKTGHRSEGITFAVQTFTAKMTAAISGATSSFFLAFIGYKPNAAQTPESLAGIFQMFTIIPVIGFALMFIIIFFFYKLDERDVKKMMDKNFKSIS